MLHFIELGAHLGLALLVIPFSHKQINRLIMIPIKYAYENSKSRKCINHIKNVNHLP